MALAERISTLDADPNGKRSFVQSICDACFPPPPPPRWLTRSRAPRSVSDRVLAMPLEKQLGLVREFLNAQLHGIARAHGTATPAWPDGTPLMAPSTVGALM